MNRTRYALLALLALTGCQPFQRQAAEKLICEIARGTKTASDANLESFRPHVVEFMMDNEPDMIALMKGQQLTMEGARRIVDYCNLPSIYSLPKNLQPKMGQL